MEPTIPRPPPSNITHFYPQCQKTKTKTKQKQQKKKKKKGWLGGGGGDNGLSGSADITHLRWVKKIIMLS